MARITVDRGCDCDVNRIAGRAVCGDREDGPDGKSGSGGDGELWRALRSRGQGLFRQYDRKGGADRGLSGVECSVATKVKR